MLVYIFTAEPPFSIYIIAVFTFNFLAFFGILGNRVLLKLREYETLQVIILSHEASTAAILH